MACAQAQPAASVSSRGLALSRLASATAVGCLTAAVALLTTAARTQIAADALGMEHSDPRGFTVTGGLPYYGQFACSAGALVRMVELLREDREAFGLVTGNGAQPDASACRQASDSLS